MTYPLNVYDTRRGADYSMDQLSRFLDRGVREQMRARGAGRRREAGSDAVPPDRPEASASTLRGRFSGGALDGPRKARRR